MKESEKLEPKNAMQHQTLIRWKYVKEYTL